jgi:acetyl-CoA carboxylase carboxyl transferase subunit beta
LSWLHKLLPPKIKRTAGATKKAVPEGLWSKCEVCETVLYRADLEKNLNVCPKCGHHERVGARERLDITLDPEGRYEIGAEVEPVDFLKFVDSKRYVERLEQARAETGEDDALVVMQARWGRWSASALSAACRCAASRICHSCASRRAAAHACRKA